MSPRLPRATKCRTCKRSAKKLAKLGIPLTKGCCRDCRAAYQRVWQAKHRRTPHIQVLPKIGERFHAIRRATVNILGQRMEPRRHPAGPFVCAARHGYALIVSAPKTHEDDVPGEAGIVYTFKREDYSFEILP